MISTVVFFLHYGILLLFGIFLSAALAGIKFTLKNIANFITLFVTCGLLQVILYALFGAQYVWKIYPLITHVPIMLLLFFYYHKRLFTTIFSITSAYLFCQPAIWFGLLFEALTNTPLIGEAVQIIVLLITGALILLYLAPYISKIYGKQDRRIILFGGIPLTYYIFDYIIGIYTNIWQTNTQIAAEFFPFFLSIVYMVFCIIYYNVYEQKNDAERKEQLIRFTIEQQAKEIQTIRNNEREIQFLRHDMRLFLENLALCIQQEDASTSLNMISGYVSRVESTSLHRYCSNDIINYTLTNFESKCQELQIDLHISVKIADIKIDEILFSSILSNALDNALNAQNQLPVSERKIKLMIKDSDSKLLFSLKNTYREKPVFVDELPVTKQKGHGLGTQHIAYLTERLGGNYMFSIDDDLFVLRIVI